MPTLARIHRWLGSLVLFIAFAAVLTAFGAHAQTAAELAQVKEGVRSIADGVEAFRAHVGWLPGSLVALIQPMVGSNGKMLPPYMSVIPSPPSGWSAFVYAANLADGTFMVYAWNGDVSVRTVGGDVVVETKK